MRPRPSLVLFSTLLAMTACTMGSSVTNGRATIVAPAIAAGEVPSLRTSTPVAVAAGTAQDDWFVLSPKDPDHLQANLKVWTGQAVEGFVRDLQTIGGSVAGGGAKTVELTVTGATGDVGFAKAGVTLILQVRTGDGRTATFTGQATSVRGLLFCGEQALRAAIVAALGDVGVRSYLES